MSNDNAISTTTTTAAEIDDLEWDALCTDPHKEYIELGKREGRDAGLKSGYNDGKDLGRSKATEIGLELGFISGFATIVSSRLSSLNLPPEREEKIKSNLERLLEALNNFPSPAVLFRETRRHRQRDDDDEGENTDVASLSDNEGAVDVVGELQRIKAKFKLVTVQLRIPHFSLKAVLEHQALAKRNQPADVAERSDKVVPSMEGTEW
mmetsp:Transcript_36880/g.45093  ORF Transcript_36880/g.45093 Transcript_36880/m.45093 type:complete len:208 (+) Transcript_36880:128-751(+)|eukprot:CAMPEP_0172489572 /NCGR_PEP_ID=MMETSP1066-20121228/19656_1 /TAXON_ID=671091 /ORGANISM="Coscinodiscus wailesii, Strain CCMP2513" /LENGTH=207 /DNA_ID=CAMNT_0013257533 /DNA_START=127 /DNA_END=747 /DNA_ORIENTATION=+